MKKNIPELLLRNTKTSLEVLSNPKHPFHQNLKRHMIQIAKEALIVIEKLEADNFKLYVKTQKPLPKERENETLT